MIEESIILAQIIFIDIVLAADNAIIIGLIAANFVPKNRKQIILWGVAGALISMTEQISPFMGFPFTIVAFVVIILGGLGNIKGGIAAGLLLGFVEIYVVVLTSANFRSILIYGLFVGVLLLRPQGLFGKTRAS